MEKKTILSLFIVAIMILSIFGIVIDSSTTTSGNKAKYNGFKFVQTNQGWRTTINGDDFFFNFFPTEIEHVEIPENIKERFKISKAMYLTYDPFDENAPLLANLQFLLEQEIPKIKETYILRGLTDSSDTPNILQINCVNATQLMPVVLLNTINSTQIYEDNNCIHIEGTGENVFMATEKILYLLAGVMK